MTEIVKCRRCSECKNYSHHWLPNPDFGNDEDEEAEHSMREYVCKHCPMTGNECPECYGSGATEPDDVCSSCDGEGVIPFDGIG